MLMEKHPEKTDMQNWTERKNKMFYIIWKNLSLQIHRNSILAHHILNYCVEHVLLYLGKIVGTTSYLRS